MKIESFVISSRIRLARNLNDVEFVSKLTNSEVATSVCNALYDCFEDDFEFRKLCNMDNSTCLRLLEEHTISKDLMENKDISAFAISDDKEISILINEEDHIRLQCIVSGFNLEKAYEKINKVDDKLCETLDIAFDKNLGFLTSCPSNVGTGMRASVMMFLPALTFNGAITALIENLEKEGITVRGLYGEGSSCDGYFYQISNKYTLGKTESEIIEQITNCAEKIMKTEQNARQILLKVNKLSIKDMCIRAYGTLTNCAMLTTNECVQLLSKIRFGVVLNLFNLKNVNILDELYTLVQDAHLDDYYSLGLSAKERLVFRAKFVGEMLENKLIKGE